MPYLEPWYCGNCGALIDAGTAERAGIRFCGSCGAALTAPPAPAAAPTAFDLRLDDVGQMRIAVIQSLPYSLPTAMDLVKRVPINVLENVPRAEAEALHQKLIAAGAQATVVGHGGTTAVALDPSAVPDPIVLGYTPWYQGVSVEARRAADDAVVASAAVEHATLSLPVPTGGAPAPVYLAVAYKDWPPYRIHFNHALRRSRDLKPEVPDPPITCPFWAKRQGITLDPARGHLVLHAAADEASAGRANRAGVGFALSAPGASILYAVERGLTTDVQETTELGEAWAFNVPPGRLEVAATAAGAALAPITVHLDAGALVEVVFWP